MLNIVSSRTKNVYLLLVILKVNITFFIFNIMTYPQNHKNLIKPSKKRIEHIYLQKFYKIC